MEDKLLYSTQDLIKILSMSKTTILKAVADGKLKCLKNGNKFYFKKEFIDEFLKSMEG